MRRGRILWNRVLVLLLGLVVACLLTYAIGGALAPRARSTVLRLFSKDDPGLAFRTAHEMIDYELPAGYAERRVIQLGEFYTLVLITSTSDPSDVIVIQPASSDVHQDSEWRGALEERAAQDVGDLHYQTQTVRIEDATIRDQPTTLRILEGEDEGGNSVRQVLGAFSGRNGSVMVMIVGDIETWDQAMVDQFLSSIH
jgi:hypothetical protein